MITGVPDRIATNDEGVPYYCECGEWLLERDLDASKRAGLCADCKVDNGPAASDGLLNPSSDSGAVGPASLEVRQ